MLGIGIRYSVLMIGVRNWKQVMECTWNADFPKDTNSLATYDPGISPPLHIMSCWRISPLYPARLALRMVSSLIFFFGTLIRLRNGDGWSGMLGRLLRTRSVNDSKVRIPTPDCNTWYRMPNPPTYWSVECVRFLPLQQPTSSNPPSCSQPASLASQPSEPGHPGIEASGLQVLMSPNCSVGHPIRRHRLPQAATGQQTFLHPQRQGGSQTCHKPWNIYDIANFPTHQIMGCVWDDHFMDLGYPSKFCRFQDVICIAGSST